jgi:hypothetical protein
MAGVWVEAAERNARSRLDGLRSQPAHAQTDTTSDAKKAAPGCLGAPTTLSLGMLWLSEHVAAVDGAYSGDDAPSASRRRLDGSEMDRRRGWRPPEGWYAR